MKTIRTLFAAALALCAVVSCSEKETPVIPGGNNKSQRSSEPVLISAVIEQPGDGNATKTHLGAEEEGKGYPVLWTEGDMVGVSYKVDNVIHGYSIAKGWNTMKGQFEPVDTVMMGGVYAYYPLSGVKTVADNIYTVKIDSIQTYKASSFGEGMMPMCAKSDSIQAGLYFKPLMSVFKINVKTGPGIAISRIIIRSDTEVLSGEATVNMETQTLTMNPGGKKSIELKVTGLDVLSTEKVTSFHLAIPASDRKQYTVMIVSNIGTFVHRTYTEKSFEVQKIKTMSLVDFTNSELLYKYPEGGQPAVMIGDVVWAPVNCGFDATNYKYGKLYQFGRAVGSGYVATDATKTYNDAGGGKQTATKANSYWTSDGCNKTPDDAKFYYYEAGLYDWYTTASSKQLPAWPLDSTYTGFVKGKIDNPCPDGWRVPTSAELTELNGNKSSFAADGITGSINGTFKGRWFSGPNIFTAVQSGMPTCPSIFLPAAGKYSYGNNGCCDGRINSGLYWSTGVNGTKAFHLSLTSATSNVNSSGRAFGFSVRCVLAKTL